MAQFSAVVDRLPLTTQQVKCLLGLPEGLTECDAFLDIALAAGKEEADRYLNNPFIQYDYTCKEYVDPAVDVPIPTIILEGVLEYVKFRLVRKRPDLDISVSEEKVSDLTRKYSKFATVQDLVTSIKATYWAGHHLRPGL